MDASGLSERLFADNMPTNLMLVGAAFQHGCLPLSASAIEHAIRLNGAAVDKNLAAFRWGRALAVDAVAVDKATAPPARATIEVGPEAAAIVAAAGVEEALRDLVAVRAADLVDYQCAAYARGYLEDVQRVATLAGRAGPEAGRQIAMPAGCTSSWRTRMSTR